MELISIFLSTFLLVFIGELGDKTQIASGTGALGNKKHTSIIFFSSAVALISVAGLTVFFAGLIPTQYLPWIIKFGGIFLILYGIYLYRQAHVYDATAEENVIKTNGLHLFITHFTVVFVAELGDKTQIATMAVALENQSHLLLVFIASSTALISVTALTVWGVTKIPTHLIKEVQKLGAALMVFYGLYMIFS